MRRIIRVPAIAALFVTFTFSFVFAQEVPRTVGEVASNHAETDSDLSAIRSGSREFINAFNKGDAKAVAALWTEGGEYLDDAGRTFSGRNAIETAYAVFFLANPKASLRINIDSLRLLSSDTAIEDGRAVVEPAPAGSPGTSKYTAVHVKQNGKWLMASVRDTWSEVPSAHRNIADLEWLIGTWGSEEHGIKTESACRWIANKNFVERKYTVTDTDGTKTEGLQLIGWNSVDGHVQSWNFSPDGGNAISRWSPIEAGWRAEVQGTTGNGVMTSAVNVLRRLDDNAYVWQSTQRTLGETALPDTDEVVIRRSPTK